MNKSVKSRYLGIITRDDLRLAEQQSRRSARHRYMITLHNPQDVVQRMVNVLQPEAYIRPHRHKTVRKYEAFSVLKGRICLFMFDDAGEVTSAKCIGGKEDLVVVADVLPPAWHTYICLEANTAVFECKEGPYDPDTDKQFAPWAPEEGSDEAQEYLSRLHGLDLRNRAVNRG